MNGAQATVFEEGHPVRSIEPSSCKETEKSQHSILLVDDSREILWVTEEAFKSRGYHVTTAPSGEAAIEALIRKRFDLVITDLHMGGMNGFVVLKKARELDPEMPVIIWTGSGDVSSTAQALGMNADDYLLKPFNLAELFGCADHCPAKAHARRRDRITVPERMDSQRLGVSVQ